MGDGCTPPTSIEALGEKRGEMRRLVGEHDWAASPLGAVETWPSGLRMAVDLVLDSLQPRLLAWGPDLTSVYNDGYVPILGDKHPGAFARPFPEIWREIWEEYGPIIAATLRGEAQYFIDQPVALTGRPGRPMSWFTFSWTPLRDDSGAVAGFLSVATETTEKVLAERALREAQEELLRRNEERYRQVFESIDQGFCVIEMIFDDDGRPSDYRFMEMNSAFERKTGLRDVKGRTMRSIAPGHEQYWFDTYGRIALTGEPLRFELPASALGRFFEVNAFRIGAPDERHVGVLFNDITERKRAEEHQSLLLAELDHRVKNVLAVVQAIVHQSLGRSGTAGVERLDGRLAALALSHRLLADSRWEGAVLTRLLADTVAAYRVDDPDRVLLSGPDVQVTPRAAQSMTLAFHELTTNAAKYGALSVPTGRVAVNWAMHDEGGGMALVIDWREAGGPQIDEPPTRRGFGTSLIATTVEYELDGRVDLDFSASGLIATMRLPRTALVEGHPVEQPLPASPRSISPAKDVPRPLAGRRILVVEDQYLVAEEIGATIEDAGGTVMGPIPTLASALEAAETAALDAASLDVNLNGDLVWPVALALRKRGIPAVLVTGYAATIAIPPELAGLARLEKPVDAGRVVNCLVSLLRAG